jgi:hypothetical protein
VGEVRGTQAAWAARGGSAARAPRGERNSESQDAFGVRATSLAASYVAEPERRGRGPGSSQGGARGRGGRGRGAW